MVTKLILQMVINRVRGRTLHEIAQEQYGYMPDNGTRNDIFILRIKNYGIRVTVITARRSTQ